MTVHSIRFKLTAFTIAAILTTILCVYAVSYVTMHAEIEQTSAAMMSLIARDTKKTLEKYTDSIEQSVDMVSNLAVDAMDSVILVESGVVGEAASQKGRTPEQTARLDEFLADYSEKIEELCSSVAGHTYGVITYYYCINPEVSQTEHGFFYSRVGKTGFYEQEPLDARTLDPEDIAHTTWYYTPIARGRPSWVGPYTAHFLGEMWICSYLVPIYKSGIFIGVLGMDIPVKTLTDQISQIRVYETGFACLLDGDGRVLWHPELEFGEEPELSDLNVGPEVLAREDSGDTLIRYTSGGEQRQMSFCTLSNGLKLVIVAPVEEVNASWQRLTRDNFIITLVILVVFATLALVILRLITGPLLRLTAASQRLANADYDAELDYHGRDEVGTLTIAFSRMRDQLRQYIDDLNRRINTDDLTGLPNMRHFFSLADEAAQEFAAAEVQPVLLYFNLGGMKHFNRQYGFPEGDRLLCAVAEILTEHFGPRRTCRIGQDQFAAIAEAEGVEETLEDIFRQCQNANDGKTLPVRVGIYRKDMDDATVSVACDRAKYACDLHRSSYVSGYYYFGSEMLQELERVRYIVNHLDQALAEQWIQVWYQPIIRAANGKVCDEEALSRWIDPVKGWISPAEFIPFLENAGLIYKLDLYVVEQVLEKQLRQRDAGMRIVPHSINLSRADFDACDIVEEIRRRVDAAGVPREDINIEITESIIGSDFDFMKEQVARFQALGFRVWMDDFGSGYSSLDVLQDIRFDLIKFDMRFMQHFGEGEDGKVILTELIRMAIGLGIDTVCEGVETEDQIRFVQEVGCSKLQGFYFSPAIPCGEILSRIRSGDVPSAAEDREETAYYTAIGKINLYDAAVISQDYRESVQDRISTLPMAILESTPESYAFIRCNNSYRAFMSRMFGINPEGRRDDFEATFERLRGKPGSCFLQAMRLCGAEGGQRFIDEKMDDGSTVHALIRRVAVNPVTGTSAFAVLVLSIREAGQEEGIT